MNEESRLGGIQNRLSYIAGCSYDQGRNNHREEENVPVRDLDIQISGRKVQMCPILIGRVTDEKYQASRQMKRVSELLHGENPSQNFSLGYSNTIIILYSGLYSGTK